MSKYYYADMALILVKSEASVGVDANPTPADNSLFCAELTVKPVITMVDKQRYGASFRSEGYIPARRHTEWTIKMPLVGGWELPGFGALPLPEFHDMMRSSGFDVTTVNSAGNIAAVKSAFGPAWDLSAYTASNPPSIGLQVDGGSTLYFPLELFNEDKYPNRNWVTPAQIEADIGDLVTAAGMTIKGRQGHLYIKSNTGTSIQVMPAGSLTPMIREVEITTPADGLWTLTLTPYEDGIDEFEVTYNATGSATAADIAGGLRTALLGLGADFTDLYGVGSLAGASFDITGVGYPFTLTLTPAAGGAGTTAVTQAYVGNTVPAAFGFSTALVTGAVKAIGHEYTPNSFNAQPTCTVYAYFFPQGAIADDQSLLIKSTGCVFNPEIVLDSNAESFITFTGKGSYFEPTDEDFPTGYDFKNRVDGMVALGATVDFYSNDVEGSRCDPFSKLTINPNWELKEIIDQTGRIVQFGTVGFHLTRKGSATGDIDNQLVPIADFDRWGLIRNANQNSLVGTWMSPRGATLTVEAINVQYGEADMSMDGRIIVNQKLAFRTNSSTGDDWLSLAFAAIDTGR